MNISVHDQLSGVIQASKGINGSLKNLIKSIIPADSDAERLNVPDSSSLLRFKLLSNQSVNLNSNGIVHFVTEYENIKNLFHASGIGTRGEPEYIKLELDRIEAVPLAFSGNDKKNSIIHASISPRDRVVLLKRNRHYIPIIRNAILPEGNYSSITAYFREPGRISFDGETEYPLYINKSSLVYAKNFSVENNRVTTLHSVPVSEYSSYLARMNNKEYMKPVASQQLSIEKTTTIYRQNLKFNLEFNIQETAAMIGGKVKEIYISMKSLSAVDANGNRILLNNTPTTFELLSLLDGAVALMGHNMLPEGTYSSFELLLGVKHSVVIDEAANPVTIEFEEQYRLNFMGPFELRGGRITEVFLEFDPDRSVFHLEKRGYVLDPSIETASVISMTSDQDLRLISALGKRSNLVVSESELIFQGSINSLNYILADNTYGKKMIYSDLSLKVEDRLRGSVEDPDHFPYRSIGGNYMGAKLKVSGMPEFKGDERFLLFLRKYGDRYGVVQGELGKINL